MTDDVEDWAKEMADKFDAECAKKGHYWSSSSLFPGTEYCQACGATRARVKVEI